MAESRLVRTLGPGGAVLLAVAAGFFVASALDGRMYWHEARLLYAVEHFSVADLTAGAFNPNDLGGESSASAAGGYHLSKLLYLEALRALVGLPLSPDAQLAAGAWLSLLAVLLCAGCVRGIALEWGATRAQAAWSAAAFLLMPTVPYLAGKLLSEVVALLPACGAVWAWSRALRLDARRVVWIAAAGLLAAVTALARLDVVALHAGFVAASLLAAPPDRRLDWLRIHAGVTAVAVTAYGLVLAMLDADPRSILDYFLGYVALTPKSLAVSALAIALHAGLLWPFVAAGLWMDAPARRLAALWLVFATVPVLFVVLNFMVEPRYLVVSLLPMSLLAGAALERLHAAARARGRQLSLAVALVIVAAVNALPIALMPFEVERDALLAAVDRHRAADGSGEAAFLVPWTYTDFHFLRYARPSAQVFNVHSPGGDPQRLDAYWDARVRDWYGERYVTEGRQVDALLAAGPVYYVGWGAYPPIETAAGWADAIGLGAVAARLRNLGFLDHRRESWLWHDARYSLRPESQHGQYTLYRVLEAPHAAGTGPAGVSFKLGRSPD